MKKILFALLLMLRIEVNAQITYEHSYPGPNSTAQTRLQLIDIGNNDYKYIYVDYGTNQLKLFNLDHSFYFSVNVPITLINEVEYKVGYVTKSLFDCDTTMFEYAIMPGDGTKNFYVYRQDGTLLFERDSTIAPYCLGCANASFDFRPIINSSAGAKLLLMKYDTIGYYQTVDVYSLCGSLPEDAMEIDAASATFVKVYPNPTRGTTDFEFDLPSNIQKFELVVYNSSAEVIKTIKIQSTAEKYHLDGIDLSSGLYFYTLNTENKTLQNGKFIIDR